MSILLAGNNDYQIRVMKRTLRSTMGRSPATSQIRVLGVKVAGSYWFDAPVMWL